ncbi:hypothetical protein HAQ00_02345 [Acidithiobacillus caldus ATCC 51756]|jgi:hypothetical protein|uniref:hypothetical protein n=1 Tax=Acidithiobacillus caldus TaxID=33059 RepID=UPI001C06C024|nr:hypothetical protein [Acidithiobacillus caldus]MBU2734585.1 hypothetical protein [Acidithiobacillus caldus ATCC 51756]MBU2801330.1 hypothetical protein [Acidithiobacillus caldus]
MRAIKDLFAILLFIAICIWGFLIWDAQPDYRPLRACQPLFFVDRGAVNLLEAGTGQTDVSTDVNDWAGDLNNGCLSFTYNLFVRGNPQTTQE